MKQCPKCGHERRPGETGAAGICPACGLVFAKWARHTLGTETLPRDREGEPGDGGRIGRFLALATEVAPRTDPIHFWGRVAAGVLPGVGRLFHPARFPDRGDREFLSCTA